MMISRILPMILTVVASLAPQSLGQYPTPPCPPDARFTAALGSTFGDALSVGATYAAISDEDDTQGRGRVAVYQSFSSSVYVVPEPPAFYLVAGDGSPGDGFGGSVAVDDGRSQVIVGAPGDDGVLADSGSAYVFDLTAGASPHIQKILPPQAWADGRFGASLSVAGDILVIGAPGDDDTVGAFYIYRHTGSTWRLERRITAPSSRVGQLFGHSVEADIDDSVEQVIVGAPETTFGTGSAYVYVNLAGGWALQQQLVTTVGLLSGDRYGAAVSIEGGCALVGAPGFSAGAPDSGGALVFERDPIRRGQPTMWTNTALLTGLSGPSANHGSSVSMGSDVCLVGAPRDGTAGFESGAAYAYRRAGAGPHPLGWALTHQHLDPVGAPGAHLGQAVDVAASLWASAPGGNETLRWRRAHQWDTGPGWPGSLGEPSLVSMSAPRLGLSASLDITSSTPVPTSGLLLVGGPTSVDVGLGGTLLVDAALFALPISVAQQLAFPLQIPFDCDLVGVYIGLQVVLLDAAATHGVAFSERLNLVIGL